MNFYMIARVLYIDMVEASEKERLLSKKESDDVESSSMERMQAVTDSILRCRLSYMQFIEHINRTGRVLKKEGYTLPLYGRIYFFRNKMIEHWDDYMQFITTNNGSGGVLYVTGDVRLREGKIGIPHSHSGARDANERLRSRQAIIDEFNAYGVVLPSVNLHDDDYSETIFCALEKIDSELRSYDRRRGTGIPETIVSLLFSYCFPIPISDMEEYCKTLIEWLRTLPVSQLAYQALKTLS